MRRLCVALVFVLAGCSGGEEGATSPTGLRDADAVLADERTAEATVGVFGEPVEAEGLTVTVSNPRPAGVQPPAFEGDVEHVLVEVDVRVENRGSAETRAFQLVAKCDAKGDGQPFYKLTESAFANSPDPYPAGSFREGVLTVGVPRDCAEPALWTEHTVMLEGVTEFAYWPLPADVLTEP